MDIFAVIGVFFGITMILIGQAMEGGNIGQLLQITAFFIVIGGTMGAVILSFPPATLKSAIFMLKDVFFPPKSDFNALITEIGGFATKARKEGIIALEKEANNASDPLLTLGLGAVADGTDPTLVREMIENQIEQQEQYVNNAAKVFESFGGYSPTCIIYEQMKVSTTPAPALTCPMAMATGVPGSIRVNGLLFSLCRTSLCGPVLGTKGGGRAAGDERSSQHPPWDGRLREGLGGACLSLVL